MLVIRYTDATDKPQEWKFDDLNTVRDLMAQQRRNLLLVAEQQGQASFAGSPVDFSKWFEQPDELERLWQCFTHDWQNIEVIEHAQERAA